MTTQKDIAEELGVSVSLVSRALAGRAKEIGVTEETIERIRRAAEEMGYVPSAAAQSLKGVPTRTIGVVVYDFEDPFFGPLIGRLQHLAHRASHSLVLAGFEQRKVETADLQPLLKHDLDGLIVIGSEEVSGWAAPFFEKEIAVARIGRGSADEQVFSVVVDEEHGFRLLLEHLHARGIREAEFVGAGTASHQRRRGFFEKIAGELGIRTRAGSAETLLAGQPLPRAVLAASDQLGLETLRTLSERGVRVPDEVAVTGFDDIPLARLTTPSLTTVRQPIADMAARALRHVIDRKQDSGEIVFTPELVLRESA